MVHTHWKTNYTPNHQNCSFQDNYVNICTVRKASDLGAKNIRHV